jgi:hypothetical protein
MTKSQSKSLVQSDSLSFSQASSRNGRSRSRGSARQSSRTCSARPSLDKQLSALTLAGKPLKSGSHLSRFKSLRRQTLTTWRSEIQVTSFSRKSQTCSKRKSSVSFPKWYFRTSCGSTTRTWTKPKSFC